MLPRQAGAGDHRAGARQGTHKILISLNFIAAPRLQSPLRMFGLVPIAVAWFSGSLLPAVGSWAGLGALAVALLTCSPALARWPLTRRALLAAAALAASTVSFSNPESPHVAGSMAQLQVRAGATRCGRGRCATRAELPGPGGGVIEADLLGERPLAAGADYRVLCRWSHTTTFRNHLVTPPFPGSERPPCCRLVAPPLQTRSGWSPLSRARTFARSRLEETLQPAAAGLALV